MMEQAANSRVNGYDLEAPSRDYAIASLSRLMAQAEAEDLWIRTCEANGISSDTNKIDELETVFTDISNQSGAIGVVGKSLVVRVMSYRTLSLNNNE